MGHLEGNFTPVIYIGRKVPKGETSPLQVQSVSWIVTKNLSFMNLYKVIQKQLI